MKQQQETNLKRPDESVNNNASAGRGAKLRGGGGLDGGTTTASQPASSPSFNGRELIGAIDQGTSSTRFLVFENKTGHLIASSQIEVKRITPKEGWVEMDANSIMTSVYATMANVHEQLLTTTPTAGALKCIGICNQRESTVVWDSQTGQPLYNVIVWMDNRTRDLVDNMIDSIPGRDFNRLKDKTGLPMSTYFSAFKLKWLIENVDSVREALREKRLLFGTVDTWILWNLTGGKHLTDVTNASRTFLMDIETLQWDRSLCKQLNIPMNILPQIRSSADDFGQLLVGPFQGTPITGVIGDQSAALFGHNCLQLGKTKATFGTGCFIMQNIGPGPLNGALSGVHRDAKRGLITTVAYKLGDKPACYALEGSIKIAGAALTWLRDNLQLIQNYEEADQLVNLTTNSAGVFFVPAFGGLYSPYWDPNAAGLYIGLSQFTKREHLVRATFDSIAFQTNDILSLMRGVAQGLMIDGGLCKSDNLCQIMADITGYDIVRPAMCETSALGAAMVAGYGASIWSMECMIANSTEASANQHQNHHYPHESLNYEEKFSSIIQSKTFRDSQRAAEQKRIQQQQSTSRQHRSKYSRTNSLSTHRTHCNVDAGGGINDDAGGGGKACRKNRGQEENINETQLEHNQRALGCGLSRRTNNNSNNNGKGMSTIGTQSSEDCEDNSSSQLVSSELEFELSNSNCPHQSAMVTSSSSSSVDMKQQQQKQAQDNPTAPMVNEEPLESSYESELELIRINGSNDENQQQQQQLDQQQQQATPLTDGSKSPPLRFYATPSSGYSSGDNFELATTNSSLTTSACLPLISDNNICQQLVGNRVDSPNSNSTQATDAITTTNGRDSVATTTCTDLTNQQLLFNLNEQQLKEEKVDDAELDDELKQLPYPFQLANFNHQRSSSQKQWLQSQQQQQQQQTQLVGQQRSSSSIADATNQQTNFLNNVVQQYNQSADCTTEDEIHAFGGRDSYGEDGYDSSTASNFDTDDDGEIYDDVDGQPLSLVGQKGGDGETNAAATKDNNLARRRSSSHSAANKPVDIFQSYISLEHRTDLVETWRSAVERSMKWTKVHHEEVRRIDYQRLSSLPISAYLFFSIGMVALSSLFPSAVAAGN